MGMKMPSWFDIRGLDQNAPEDQQGIQNMAEEVRKLIEKTKEDFGVEANKIVIGGFSQGGGLALYTGLTHAEKLGGIIALSTWLPLREYVIKRMNEDNFCPILMGHGTDDGVVPLQWGSKSAELIKEKGVEIEWKKYSGVQHSSCPQEFGDIKSFLDKTLF
jgi:predicted esterase